MRYFYVAILVFVLIAETAQCEMAVVYEEPTKAEFIEQLTVKGNPLISDSKDFPGDYLIEWERIIDLMTEYAKSRKCNVVYIFQIENEYAEGRLILSVTACIYRRPNAPTLHIIKPK